MTTKQAKPKPRKPRAVHSRLPSALTVSVNEYGGDGQLQRKRSVRIVPGENVFDGASPKHLTHETWAAARQLPQVVSRLDKGELREEYPS